MTAGVTINLLLSDLSGHRLAPHPVLGSRLVGITLSKMLNKGLFRQCLQLCALREEPVGAAQERSDLA
jgi:hypothetical protein